MNSNKELVSIYPKHHRGFSVDQQPYYNPSQQEYRSLTSSGNPHPYIASPENKLNRERGPGGFQEFSPTSSHSSSKSNSSSQRAPVIQPIYHDSWPNHSPTSRFSSNSTFYSSLEGDISARHKKAGNSLPSPSLDPHKNFKPNGHSKSLISTNIVLESREDSLELPTLPAYTKRSAHKVGHQRSYSMLAEPFSRGYCGLTNEKSYSFPKKDPPPLYSYPKVNSFPAYIKSHQRFPSTQLPSTTQGTHDNSKKFGNPLSHSFSSRSESGREVFYFEMPATPSKPDSNVSCQGSFQVKVEPNGLTSCDASLVSPDRADYSRPRNAEKNKSLMEKAKSSDFLGSSKGDSGASMPYEVSLESDALGNKKSDPPLRGITPKRRINHKKHLTLGSPLDINLLEEPASSGTRKFSSEILNLGDETLVELFDLLINYQNPWGTRSVDEGQMSKEIKDDSHASNCGDEEANHNDILAGSKSCASILQENFPKIARVQTWLSQNVSPENLASETNAANRVTRHSLGIGHKSNLDEFDGDVLIGDFFSHSETKLDHLNLNSDDGSHTHVESKESDSHFETQAHVECLDQAPIFNDVGSLKYKNPSNFVDVNFHSPHAVIFSPKRRYERRPPTPDYTGEFGTKDYLEAPLQVRSYSPRPPTPEELSDLTTSIVRALDASFLNSCQIDHLNELHEGQESIPLSIKPEMALSSSNSQTFEIVHEKRTRDSCSVVEASLNESLDRFDTCETLDSKSPLPDDSKPDLPEIEGRFCFDTPVGPRKLVWLKGALPLEAASAFCLKYGITNPSYSKALAWFLANSCK